MKKSALTLTILLVSSLASASALQSDKELPAWDHKNDHGEIVSLQEVKHTGIAPNPKNDTRIQYTADGTDTRTDSGYDKLGGRTGGH